MLYMYLVPGMEVKNLKEIYTKFIDQMITNL